MRLPMAHVVPQFFEVTIMALFGSFEFIQHFMAPYGSQWLKMAQDGSRWLNMAHMSSFITLWLPMAYLFKLAEYGLYGL